MGTANAFFSGLSLLAGEVLAVANLSQAFMIRGR
jgi:hypothetical protein